MRPLLTFTCLLMCVSLLTGASTQRPKLMSMSYTPSGIASEAARARGISEARITADLEHLVPYTQGIRTYSLDFGLDRVPAIAAKLGLKVSLGIWLGKDLAKNDADIEAALPIIAANRAAIDRIYVGNEAVVRGDLTAAQVAAYVAKVRSKLGATHPPLGTAEPWHIWLAHPDLAPAVDFIGAHIFSYWDGVPVEAGADNLDVRFDAIHKAYPAKPIIIAETGWPVSGVKNQAAMPSREAQAKFLRAFLRDAARRGYIYNIVEAYDQPWKVRVDGGSMWGMLNDNGTPRFDFFAP